MRKLLLVCSVFLFAGCFHATIETGAAPSSTVIQTPWAMSYVYGLIPPATVEAQGKCGPKGVSKVETQISFLNGLVAGLTFSIVTPMTITVTCAQ